MNVIKKVTDTMRALGTAIVTPIDIVVRELVREAQAARYYRGVLARLAEEVGAEPDDMEAIVAAVRRRGVAIDGAFELRAGLVDALGWRVGSNRQIISAVKSMAERLNPQVSGVPLGDRAPCGRCTLILDGTGKPSTIAVEQDCPEHGGRRVQTTGTLVDRIHIRDCSHAVTTRDSSPAHRRETCTKCGASRMLEGDPYDGEPLTWGDWKAPDQKRASA